MKTESVEEGKMEQECYKCGKVRYICYQGKCVDCVEWD